MGGRCLAAGGRRDVTTPPLTVFAADVTLTAEHCSAAAGTRCRRFIACRGDVVLTAVRALMMMTMFMLLTSRVVVGGR